MISKEHQWLVLWVARKMVADGVSLTGFDGPAPQGGVWNELPCPPLLGQYRPDVLGVSGTGTVVFGEAKTAFDIEDVHTAAQLRAFTAAAPACWLYLAVPRSTAYRLDRVLARTALPGTVRVVRMHVPDCFVREVEHDYA